MLKREKFQWTRKKEIFSEAKKENLFSFDYEENFRKIDIENGKEWKLLLLKKWREMGCRKSSFVVFHFFSSTLLHHDINLFRFSF